MSRYRLGTVCLTLLALLAFPRQGSASILDFIWEMSGPQMIGAVFVTCKLDVTNGKSECRPFPDKDLKGRAGKVTDINERRFWVSLEATAYVSTGKDSDSRSYDAFRNGMLAAEPILEVKSVQVGEVRFYHGIAGLAYNRVFGKDFDSFNKVGVKFRPVGAMFKGWDVAFNLRLYPDGFTPDQFGVGPQLDNIDRPHEFLWGFSVGRAW